MDFKLICNEERYVKSAEAKMSVSEALLVSKALSNLLDNEYTHESDKRTLVKMLSDMQKGRHNVQSKED